MVAGSLDATQRAFERTSERSLATDVLELTQTLGRQTHALAARNAEKEKLLTIQAEFRKHLAWQQNRIHALQRNIERLNNEDSWLQAKGGEVAQDALLLSHEVRQCKEEIDQLVCERDSARAELRLAEDELKLEKDSATSLKHVCVQANKAFSLHLREHEVRKAELVEAKQGAFRMKDRVEKLAYQLNGVGAI